MTSGVQAGSAVVAGYMWSLRISAHSPAFLSGVAVTGHVRSMAGI